MSALPNVYPGSIRQWETFLIDSAATNKQLVRGPWPIGQKLVLRKLIATNRSGTPCVVDIWDQDLSSTSSTPPSRGSATGPLISIGVGATNTSGSATTVVLGETNLPAVVLEAGFAMQSTAIATVIVAEFERI